MADGLKSGDENEVILELSIGGIFGQAKKTNRNANGSKCAVRRRRKREEKMDFGSCGSFVEDKEWLEKQVVKQNDDDLENGPLWKKARIGKAPENIGSVLMVPVSRDGRCTPHQGVATDDSRSNSSSSQLDQQLAVTDPCDQPVGSSKQTMTNSTVSSPSPVNPPETSIQHKEASVLARMPCVSTTGNGPNGRTVSGFLYRYTKNEVSIVCVCHGASFSPAGFVEHAGGVDIAHPLKHITIFPAAFAS